jgi:hypothetical protein
MNRNLNPWNQITVCHKSLCLKATGRLAKIIGLAIVTGIVLAGIAFIVKQLNK